MAKQPKRYDDYDENETQIIALAKNIAGCVYDFARAVVDEERGEAVACGETLAEVFIQFDRDGKASG